MAMVYDDFVHILFILNIRYAFNILLISLHLNVQFKI